MTPQTRRRLYVIAALVLLCYTGWVAYVRLFGPAVVSNAEVGRTEPTIRAWYGTPEADDPGYRSLGLSIPTVLPPGQLRTLRFRPGGLLHPEGGTLVVWLRETDNGWVCFESCWFGPNVNF